MFHSSGMMEKYTPILVLALAAHDPRLYHRHGVGGQGAGLVAADHGRAALPSATRPPPQLR